MALQERNNLIIICARENEEGARYFTVSNFSDKCLAIAFWTRPSKRAKRTWF